MNLSFNVKGFTAYSLPGCGFRQEAQQGWCHDCFKMLMGSD